MYRLEPIISLHMDWISQLPERLRNAAYRANNEYAWSRTDAVDVIDWLSSRNLPVVGVELWLPTQPGPTIPTPYIYEWSAPANVSGPLNASIQNEMAKKYISEFEWDERDLQWHGQIPYFNLTV
jgi:hypothetical protein